MCVQEPKWDKFLKGSGRVVRPAKDSGATIVTECVEVPIEDFVEVRQIFSDHVLLFVVVVVVVVLCIAVGNACTC